LRVPDDRRTVMADKYKHTPQERNAMLRQLKRIIDTKDERELMRFLREHGIKDENPRFSQLVKAFREGKIDEALAKKP
jgi:ribosomal protein L12E/L44/L45/RPP1/RPP2